MIPANKADFEYVLTWEIIGERSKLFAQKNHLKCDISTKTQINILINDIENGRESEKKTNNFDFWGTFCFVLFSTSLNKSKHDKYTKNI